MAKKRKGVARRQSAAPRFVTRTRWKTRYKDKPKKRAKRGRKKKSSAGTVAAVVGTGIAAAGVGALANEAGLLQAVPTQNKTGVSLVGWTGLVVTGVTLLFAKSEGAKIIGYGIGGGLTTTELTRQIDMRGYDFRVAFGGAPPLTFDPTPPRGLTTTEQEQEDALRNALQSTAP